MNDYSNIKPFRFWCQKVLPLVYDDSLSYYELLCKLTEYINHIINDINTLTENEGELEAKFNELKNYVDNYFNNLDVQTEINNKLDEMVNDGSLDNLLSGKIMLKSNISPLSSNNTGVISEMFECAITYLQSDKLYYGNFYTAYDFKNGSPNGGINNDGKYQIDCSSFVELVLKGCDFDASRYNGNDNNYQNRLYGFSYYNNLSDERSDNPPLRYTANQAEFVSKNGYGFTPNYDWTNVQAGDIVWLNENVETLPTENNPLGVDHCCIYIGKHPSGDLMFFEAGGIVPNMVAVLRSNQVVRITRRTKTFMLERTKIVGRFPLGGYNKVSNNLCFNAKNVVSTQTQTTFRLGHKFKSGELYTLVYEYSGSGTPIVITDTGYQGYPSTNYNERISFTITANNDFEAVSVRGDNVVFKNISVYKGFCYPPDNENDKYIEQDTTNFIKASYLTNGSPAILKTPDYEGFLMSNNNIGYGVFKDSNNNPCCLVNNNIYGITTKQSIDFGLIKTTGVNTTVNFTKNMLGARVVACGVGGVPFLVSVSDVNSANFIVNVEEANIGKYVYWFAIR